MRIPQGMLLRRMPVQFNYLISLNPFALARVLFGKTFFPFWPALHENRRNYQTISDEVFERDILSSISRDGFTAWVYFYNRGRDMINQMEYQLDVFLNKVSFPVYIIQGREDKGQVRRREMCGTFIACISFYDVFIIQLLHDMGM